MSCFIKQSTLANIKTKEKGDEKRIQEIEKTRNFLEKPDEFSEEVIDGLFKDLEHKKVEHPYVEPQAQDAETKESNKKKKMINFQVSIKSLNDADDDVNDAATQQKMDYEVIDLIGNIKDEDNPFNIFKADPKDIFIDDNLFDSFDQNDKKDIKMVSDDILQDKDLDQIDVLFEELLTRSVKRQIIKANTRLELVANKI